MVIANERAGLITHAQVVWIKSLRPFSPARRRLHDRPFS